MGKHVTMLLFSLTVVFSVCSCRSIFRPPIKPNIKFKTEHVWDTGKKVIKHAPTVLEVADIALGFGAAKVNPDGYVIWKNLKKMLLPDLKTLKEKMMSYGPKLDDLYSILDTLHTNMNSETLKRTNLTNVLGKVQESIKRTNSTALKTWTVMKRLQGMSVQNEVLGGIGATGSSFILFCALVISYIKYKAEQKVREAKKLKKEFSAIVRNYMADQHLPNDRFQDVTEELQLVPGQDGAQAQFLQGGQQQEAVEGSAQQNESSSFLARLF